MSDSAHRNRDLGLDCIRVAGLLLMVCTHYFERQPHDTPAAEWLLSLVDPAPAYFFFAFGMTSLGFGGRPEAERRESLWLLFYFALAHNLYMWRLLVLGDFMFFLFLSRLVLLGVERSFEQPVRVVATAFALLLGGSLLLPDAAVLSRWSQETIGGHFTLIPWILFPVAGYLYRAARLDSVSGLCLGIAGLAAGTLLDYFGAAQERASWEVVKWPLTGAYLLFHAGAVLCCLEGVNLLQGWLRRVPGLATGLRAVSTRLLTATALHYLVLLLLFWLVPKLSALPAAVGDEDAQVRSFFVGCTIAIAALLCLLWASEAIWLRLRASSALQALRDRSAAVALLLLASIALINNRPARAWLEGNDWDPMLGRYLALAAMIYFALELAEWQRSRRQGTTLS